MVDSAALKATNAKRWANAKQTRNFFSIARSLCAPAVKARYQAVEKRTGVPWFVIAVIHEREASQNWKTQLGQGDPLDQVSTHVPKGRGPFKTWEDGAVDALMNCAPFAGKNRDWSIGGTLTMLEAYNGYKYASAGRPSPYVWSGTSIYDPPTGPGGKVLVDHGPIEDVYPPGSSRAGQRVVDIQPGCANLLVTMQALDPSIKFGGTSKKAAGTVIVATGAAAGKAAHAAGLSTGAIVAIALAAVAAVVAGYFMVTKWRKS